MARCQNNGGSSKIFGLYIKYVKVHLQYCIVIKIILIIGCHLSRYRFCYYRTVLIHMYIINLHQMTGCLDIHDFKKKFCLRGNLATALKTYEIRDVIISRLGLQTQRIFQVMKMMHNCKDFLLVSYSRKYLANVY